VAELKAQLLTPLTAGDITTLKGVLSAEKVKLGDGELCLYGLALLDKLDSFLNPKLDLKKKSTEKEPETAGEGPSNPETDDETTEE